ncbi:hypothetical protein [Streptomyces fodineus]|nr:hypothetical protein [Streptomyces fodineus]
MREVTVAEGGISEGLTLGAPVSLPGLADAPTRGRFASLVRRVVPHFIK